MESSLKQFISSANGANHDHSELSTSPKSSPPPASPKKFSALPVISKIPIITPHTQLTGEAALANRIRSQSPKHMSDEIETKRERPQESPADTQVSPNPAAAVLSNYPMSRPTDVPNREDSPASHKGLAALPSIATAANAMDTSGGSPNTATSMTTNGSAGDSSATPATAGSGGTTDPALLHPNDTNHPSYQPIGLHQNRSNSLSDQFSATTPTTPGGFAHTPTTPYSPSTPGGSRGKHTCHHCNQTFTRHHNLKSHLLTHSHEKPFLCSTCQARFRRLHDLKRHSKLHTGERPHVCNKCGRKFARGDALARHARAEGGCAGRRSSMAGMLNEDGSIVQGLGVDQEDGMEGLEGLIGADPDGDVDMMGSDGGTGGSRRRSLPSIRTDFSNAGNAPGNPITPASGASTFSHTPTPHHSNTYPTLNTPRNTASTSGPSPASGASLFAPHLGVKPNTSSATSPMQTSATTVASATPTSGVAATGGSILSPHGIMS
ncbi:hypothetical protein EDC01DRAFT_216522 [Geopyxis carbonaria]|nr:hypothetical protein EDC01DRAFT_216522 [Geopyxis carbonaria]